MREIDFMCFAFGKMYDSSKCFGLSPDGAYWQFADQGYFVNNSLVTEFNLLQYTGLCLSKTGQKVFESFIIKTPNGHIGKIVFGQKKYRFGIDEIEVNGWLFERLSDGHLETLDSSILEGDIIGNIYENPELL